MRSIILRLKEAPPELANESGDPKALCYEFKVTNSCGHPEMCRIWFPFGDAWNTSKLIERYVEAGVSQCRAAAKKSVCSTCEPKVNDD